MSALTGVLIADFGRVLAGPYATMLLADLGAEVIKIECPGQGDDTRSWAPPYADGEATYFLGLNRNKRSVALDLSDRTGRAIARELAVRADVLVENFRTGTMERLGLGYEQLRADNPGLVYCSVTGFGAGPGAGKPGYDLLVQAMGGLMSVTGEPDRPGVKAGVALVDVITGLHAAVGILAALRHRERTGAGQRVQVCLLSSLLSALTNQASGYVAAGVIPTRMGNRHPSLCPYELFDTADLSLVIAVGNDRQFQSLCSVLDRPDLAADRRYAGNADRVAHREPLTAALNTTLRTQTAGHWSTLLTAAGVPCGPVNDLAAAFKLATSLGLEPVVEVDDPRRDRKIRQVANPIRLDAAPATYRLAPPRLDEDASWVYEMLGL